MVESENTDALVESYWRDGAVLVNNLFSAEELEGLRQGIELNLAQLSERALVASRPDDPGRFVEDFCNWQRNSAYEDFIRGSALGPLASRLMGSRQVRLFHDHLLVKDAGTRQATPWHQDLPYYNVAGRQNVSFWIPVDHVPREASMKCLAGSHLGPWFVPRTFMDKQAKWFPEGSLAEVPDVEGNRDDYEILAWELSPGDAIAFHMLTLHAAPGVAGKVRRRVFSVRLLGDDMVHAPRPWKTSPDFPGLADELPAGAAMDHALFPIVFGV